MEIYLDANATTPVLPQARDAAIAVMSDTFGNPSSIHGAGLRARTLLDATRAQARRVLGAESGRVFFTSGATEGIQTAILSALTDICRRREDGKPLPLQLLYGATEHKAIPEALKYWNAQLDLNLPILAIPVDRDGRHDLSWLREQAPRAGLVCTMAANNETGVVSDLDGIAAALAGSPTLWLVDGVQGLGKMPMRLSERRIDYAPFSGHKLYAPKGIGMLYVREGAPFSPLLIGGGQEGGLRAGTENMPGIAALGAVLHALDDGKTFADPAMLKSRRADLIAALQDAFPGVLLNANPALSLPTTLNFSVPGISSRMLLDLFDAAGLRVSGGSACSASKARPSYVLQAMGLPDWQAAAAVRLSFGAADNPELIQEACTRIRACGASLRVHCLTANPVGGGATPSLVNRFVVDGSCCYLVADASSRRCVVIDPLSELTQRLAQWVECSGFKLVAVLDTHSHGDHTSSAGALRVAVPANLRDPVPIDALGWPEHVESIVLGNHRLTRMPLPGHTADSTTYLLQEGDALRFAFVGDTVMPGALGRSDFEQSKPLAFAASLRILDQAIGPDALLLSGHDYDDRLATTLRTECRYQPLLADALEGGMDSNAFAQAKSRLELNIGQTAYQTMACGARTDVCMAPESVELSSDTLNALLQQSRHVILVDVREAYEQDVGPLPVLPQRRRVHRVPLSALVNELPAWNRLPADVPIVFLCRSGNRSAQAAQALRRLGRDQAWSLKGGLALCDAAGLNARLDALSAVAE